MKDTEATTIQENHGKETTYISPENRIMIMVYAVMPLVGSACLCVSQVTNMTTEAIVTAGVAATFAIGTKVMGTPMKLPSRPPKYEWIPKEKNQMKPWLRNTLILAASSLGTIINPALGAGAGLAAWYTLRNRNKR